MADRTAVSPTVRTRLVDLAFAGAWSAVRALPEPVARAAFRTAADRVTARGGSGVTQLWRNLRRVVGPDLPQDELHDLVRDGMRSYARYWMETFRLPTMDKRKVAKTIDDTIVGVRHIDDAMTAGNGLIIALPHIGNWDAAGVWLISHGVPFMTVAERLQPESLFDRFVAYRQSLGMQVIPLTGGQQPPVEPLVEHLRAGGCICLVADRDLSRRGVPVEFFGSTARMPAGPAMLAAMTGATLVTAALANVGEDAWRAEISPPLAVPGHGRLADRTRAGVALLAANFEQAIRASPQDWHMLQKLWEEDLAPGGRADGVVTGGADRACAAGGDRP